jgi:hypothetical protein
LKELPDVLLDSQIFYPCSLTVRVDRLDHVGNIGKRDEWVSLKMLLLWRSAPRGDPANLSLPYWMQNTGSWSIFTVNSGDVTPDRFIDPCEKFVGNLGKCGNSQKTNDLLPLFGR